MKKHFINCLLIIMFFQAKSQIEERVIYLDSTGNECTVLENPKEKIAITKVLNHVFIIAKFRNFIYDTNDWYANHYYTVVSLTHLDSVFYIENIYEADYGDSLSVDVAGQKVSITKENSLFLIKIYNENDILVKKGYSKYSFPFLWQGLVIEYNENGQIKKEQIYAHNKVQSTLYYTSTGEKIDHWYSINKLDEKPVFINSTINENNFLKAFMTLAYRNIRYPEKARNAGIMGTVIVLFILTKTGQIECVEVVRGAHPFIDDEAMRGVCNVSGVNISPGVVNNKAVNTRMAIPIKFFVE